MLKRNVQGIEKMMGDWLQYRWRMYLHAKKYRDMEEHKANPDFLYYTGACGLIESIGGEWRRNYRGDDSEEQLNDPKYYSHWVILPSDETCKRLNFDAWEG